MTNLTTEENMTELKPCPFCGEIDFLDYRVNHSIPDNITNYTIACVAKNGKLGSGCGTVLGYSRSVADAVKKWNTRAEGKES